MNGSNRGFFDFVILLQMAVCKNEPLKIYSIGSDSSNLMKLAGALRHDIGNVDVTFHQLWTTTTNFTAVQKFVHKVMYKF